MTPLRFSNLKLMGQSPAHYLAGLTGREDTPSLLFGRLVHALVLGGKYAVYEGERRGNAWKEWKQQHADVETIVTSKEYDKARRVADAVRSSTVAAPYLIGAHEHRLRWDLNGRACKGTLDVLGDGFVTDLKTARTAHPDRFRWEALRMGYHAQLAWYLDGANAAGVPPVRDAYLVAVETAAPYAVTVMHVAPRALEEGRKMCRLWMEQLATCEASQHWPGYVQSVVELDTADGVELEFEEAA